VKEAVAIVGLACRFPRASSPDAYWKLLFDGTDVVRDPPRGRPELEPPPWLVEQAPHARRGGFLDEVDRFEPSFFRISPREAVRMDPQQRLLLEVAWEALEDAGQPVAGLAGSTTGVFVGVMNADFARKAAQDLTQIDSQLGPGSSLGIAPNRISFAFDLRGPSMAIDTLCSSSLVAIHLACQSVLFDESAPIAIAGGVNVILDRTMDVFYARAGLLAKDGHCRAFDAHASGIVRGEGCGMIVLKRLSRALADGDRIHAVIAGSAVNQDGRSNGLTSPSRWSQEEVLRTAYRRAGVAPGTVAYVEAHGTGTLIGDPIESAALGAVLGEGREAPCMVGSVKSNLGHLESAAGVASLIKAVLSLKNRTFLPSLHYTSANPYARLEERKLAVATQTSAWIGERLCGVSSFGMGGTNAHIVLAAAELAAPRTLAAAGPVLIPLSARSPAALDELELRTRDQLTRFDPRDIAHTLGVRRDHHDHRRVILSTEPGTTLSGTVVASRAHTIVFVVPDHSDREPGLVAALVEQWRAVGVLPDSIVRVTAGQVDPVALGEDSTIFVELSTRPTLVEALRRMLAQANAIGTVVANGASRSELLRAVGALYCAGLEIDWRGLDAAGARFVALGAYPWQRETVGAREVPPVRVLVPSWQRAAPGAAANPDGAWAVHGDDAAVVSAALEKAGQRIASLGKARNVVVLCGAELAPVVSLVQSLATRDVRLWLVTGGLESSPAWGFGRVVMNEMPRLHCTLVESSDPQRIVDALLAGDGEREVALRDGERYVARLERQALARSLRVKLREDAAYLVTGGLGGLGITAAKRLVERGARKLVLLGRRGAATDEARRALVDLAIMGGEVSVEHVDVAERRAMAGVFERHRIRGVIHAAGVMEPAMIATLDASRIAELLAAKVEGARHIHELSDALDHFVMYSSVATLLGMTGQGAYAAANAYLDALAAHRRARGQAAVSIAWPAIAGTGMAAAASGRELEQLADRGVPSITLDAATDLLDAALGEGTPPCIGVVDFDVARWAAHYPHVRANPRLASLAAAGELPPEPQSAPRSAAEIEAYLTRTLAAILHAERLDHDRPLVDLGIDSLIALELQEKLQSDLELDVPTDRLLAKISIRELAAELALRFTGTVVTASVSLREDAVLDPQLTFSARSVAAPDRILLTGATGFLGAFVLADLLEQSAAHVHCLVRAQSASDGMRRLERTLDRYGLPALDLASRVTCLPGDLAQPRLGLDECPDVDTIVHSGASVNFVYPYEALKGPNVDGTVEILRLAAERRARLHYVSTIGVFPGGPTRPLVMEHARSTQPDELTLGYMRAKWVAEELVVQARDRGLDVSIYRPGTISGHSLSGAFNPEDFVCALIKGCIQLGIAPRVDAPVHLAPVDYVSKALVKIALGLAPADTYHLVGQQPVTWSRIVALLRPLGYTLSEIPYAEWRAILIERAVATGNALAPLLSLFSARETTDWLFLPEYDDTNTRRATGLVCPPIEPAIVRRYVERFVVSGYLPRPR
jgi:thioester reductase-like protein